MELQLDRVETALGTLLVVTDDTHLCALDYDDYHSRMMALLNQRHGPVTLTPAVNPLGIGDRLQSYFAGDLAALEEIAVNPSGTAFQQQVWAMLRRIPPGQTTSYGALAAQLGKPKASRAVGLANSLNPIAIVIPCHRVIGANGTLTGYAGGLERKRWLLQHEGCRVDLRAPSAKASQEKDGERSPTSPANTSPTTHSPTALPDEPNGVEQLSLRL
ncbi:MAG TPA: methylated-DNA--[protein]-cysteine S-methyltransferase [Chroococcidiopsis sp.]